MVGSSMVGSSSQLLSPRGNSTSTVSSPSDRLAQSRASLRASSADFLRREIFATWDLRRGHRVAARLCHMLVISEWVSERNFSHGTNKARWRTEFLHKLSEQFWERASQDRKDTV